MLFLVLLLLSFKSILLATLVPDLVKIPSEVLDLVTEFSSNPFRELRLLNKAMMALIPSAQDQLCSKFGTRLFQNLPSNPELWHLINFRGSIEDLVLKDTSRFLPISWPIILDAFVEKLRSGELSISNDNIRLVLATIAIRGSIKSFNLLVKIRPVSAHGIDQDYLVNAAIQLGQVEPEYLINYYQVSPYAYLVASLVSVTWNREILDQVESKHFSQIDFLTALLDAISRSSKASYDKFANICASLLTDEEFREIVETFLFFRYFPEHFDLFRLTFLLADLNHIKHVDWREFFILAALQSSKLHQFIRPLLNSVKMSKLRLSEKIQLALLESPNLLDSRSAEMFLTTKRLNEYRAKTSTQKSSEFSIKSTQDAILASHIFTDKAFERLLEACGTEYLIGFGILPELMQSLLNDTSRLSKLKILAAYLKRTPHQSIKLVKVSVSFHVIRAILEDFLQFSSIFEIEYNYGMIIDPAVMAEILRDSHLFSALVQHKDLILSKTHFSFVEAIPIFIEYDWNRLFSLSNVPLNFEFRTDDFDARSVMQSQNTMSLSESLSNIKHNFHNFIIWNFRFMQIPERLVVIDVLKQMWKKASPETFKKF
jgi:hypothetical protein